MTQSKHSASMDQEEGGSSIEGRYQSYTLEPSSPSAFACFGSWEAIPSCMPLGEGDDPFMGCSQARECKRFTFEQNPPTTPFEVKPRRDGRFEVQLFKDFIGENASYQVTVTPGDITVTYPGKRKVPKSKRFFLHIKHLEEAGMKPEDSFELVVTLDRMQLRRAASHVFTAKPQEDKELRRKKLAAKMKKKAVKKPKPKAPLDESQVEIDLGLEEIKAGLKGKKEASSGAPDLGVSPKKSSGKAKASKKKASESTEEE